MEPNIRRVENGPVLRPVARDRRARDGSEDVPFQLPEGEDEEGSRARERRGARDAKSGPRSLDLDAAPPEENEVGARLDVTA